MGCEGSTSKTKSKSIKNRKLPKANPIESSPQQPENNESLVRDPSPPSSVIATSTLQEPVENSVISKISKIFKKHTHLNYSVLFEKQVFVLNFDKQGHLKCLEKIMKVLKKDSVPDMDYVMLYGLAPENLATVNKFLSRNFPKKVGDVLFLASKNTLSKFIS